MLPEGPWKSSLAVVGCLCAATIAHAQAVSSSQTNPGFESMNVNLGVPTGWNLGTGASVASDNGPSGSGSNAAAITGANADWRGLLVDANPGDQITLSFDYKFLAGATGTVRADLRYNNVVLGDNMASNPDFELEGEDDLGNPTNTASNWFTNSSTSWIAGDDSDGVGTYSMQETGLGADLRSWGLGNAEDVTPHPDRTGARLSVEL